MRLNQRIRRRIVEQSHRAGVGHIGSALSVADILAALFGGALRGEGAERERFILSKGHAVLALYAALTETGVMAPGQLDSFCEDGSGLGAHPEHAVDGIDFSTGSLGHGLPIAVGAALAARLEKSTRRTFVLMSDAELNEGSTWEATMFAAHHGLGSLVAIVDVNGQQALGYTRDVLNLEPLGARFCSFGWSAHEADGHDVDELRELIDRLDGGSDQPHVILARTTFGHGVSFMENELCWHYWPLSDEQFERALADIETVPEVERVHSG